MFVKCSLIVLMSVIFCTGCEDNLMKRDGERIPGSKTFGESHEGPGGFTDHPLGDRYPYPQIIDKVYIPPYDLFANTKCLAWRITWPEYAGSADIERIPTVFTLNGALNSFYVLNGALPQKTYNTKFSLYYDNKVISSNGMWDELEHTFDALENMETVRFAKVDKSVSVIKFWVEERPDQFENYWPGSSDVELEYESGDFFIYELTKQHLYGGIRIVSMSPRIVEVYLAVPNL